MPTFVLLNHIDDLYSLKTFAHEMGHAFHAELSKGQGPIYCSYSTSLAETASTLFETIAGDAIYESLPDKEKIILLHDRISDSIASIFRQIACFNYENEIHQTIRTKGYMSKEELADAHNKHMQAYLGPALKMTRDDGYMFVSWMHLRYFFYVYSYAYGLLVSKALLRRYRKDKSFWKKIEQFLSAGGKDSPENILKEIGIDVSKPDFWKEGLKEIEDDIKKLEKLTQK
jgi:oligoendopeptidase F